MHRAKTGEYVMISTVGEKVQAFVPQPLPPVPPMEISGALRDSLDRAHLEIGRLDGISSILPDAGLFLYMYIRKEAVLSSQIEGTQSSLSDLLLFEMEGAPGVPLDDVREVSNYVAAMEHGLKRLRGGFPLCNRLICEIHEKLLRQGRGAEKKHGEFRTSQNWIGGTRPGNARFVPPPPERLPECLSAFEKFLNDEPERTPTLLKAALTHVQFETIHPFLDGNGRVGRLLIALLLCHECAESIQRSPLHGGRTDGGDRGASRSSLRQDYCRPLSRQQRPTDAGSRPETIAGKHRCLWRGRPCCFVCIPSCVDEDDQHGGLDSDRAHG